MKKFDVRSLVFGYVQDDDNAPSAKQEASPEEIVARYQELFRIQQRKLRWSDRQLARQLNWHHSKVSRLLLDKDLTTAEISAFCEALSIDQNRADMAVRLFGSAESYDYPEAQFAADFTIRMIRDLVCATDKAPFPFIKPRDLGQISRLMIDSIGQYGARIAAFEANSNVIFGRGR
ncbi:hypothetical protein M2336_003583 [Sphingobium sp. B1D7B]|uniref:helix-turn-helix domain-containing protein n=1 Tax=Sphingobium sp. B1D7B TaxID=2940578 RepID=UPI002225645F|nr:helix-turn-helix domain-containing protein [Sphingobium sp. B1D7B]MCW2406899.1 hypothetical protein [Sphingobium sp. B1D7B]